LKPFRHLADIIYKNNNKKVVVIGVTSSIDLRQGIIKLENHQETFNIQKKLKNIKVGDKVIIIGTHTVSSNVTVVLISIFKKGG
jgi:ribosomal protein S17